MEFKVRKWSGDLVPFNEQKFIRSLQHSGAGTQEIKAVLSDVRSGLYDGISTREIYKKAFALLKQQSKSVAARYKLKKAIRELGPTGFPFEKYVGELLRHQGFDVHVGVFVQGHCVQHEVDVVAEKDREHFMIECKFHSDPGRKCNVQVPLYIQSRFLDVKAKWEKQQGHGHKFHQGWVVTNTCFSEDAIQYGNCMGLKLISWDYPRKDSLKERIDSSGLHPITCLSSLTGKEKQVFLDKGIVLCKSIHHDPSVLVQVGVNPKKHASILKEIAELCQYD